MEDCAHESKQRNRVLGCHWRGVRYRRCRCESSEESGANVLALDVDQTTGLELAAQTGALFRACDVGDFAQWQQFAHYLNSVQTDLGTPTHIHLNAGIQIAPPDAPLSEYQFEAATLSRYKRMMSVNVDGVVFGLQTLLPLLSPGAAIVVTASLAGVTPYAIDPLLRNEQARGSGG